MTDYYDEVSYGDLSIAPASESHGTSDDGVIGWLTLGRAHPNNNPVQNRATARDAILAANARDLAAGEANGLTKALLDRLKLDPARLAGIADAVAQVADLPDAMSSAAVASPVMSCVIITS